MMFPVYRDRTVQPGTAMTAHSDEVRCHTGAGPFFSSRELRAQPPGDAHPLRRSKSTYALPHPPQTATRLIIGASPRLYTTGLEDELKFTPTIAPADRVGVDGHRVEATGGIGAQYAAEILYRGRGRLGTRVV